jgi:hypothetical protein
MRHLFLLAFALALPAASCGGGTNPTDGGREGGGVWTDLTSSAPSLSCYVPDMYLCKEEPVATPAQHDNAPTECSSLSGVFCGPADCPTAGFVGKCTYPASDAGMDGVQIVRYYTGSDAAYQQDFCTRSPGGGTWSTTF